jgi:hypothetical protein
MQQSEIETSDLSTLKTPHIAVRAGGEKLQDHQQRFYQADF